MSDNFWHWVARHTPKKLRYWVVIVVGADATCRVYRDRSPDQVNLIELLGVAS